jgi:RNA polymerase sigma-70 factor (ECF subfamily)
LGYVRTKTRGAHKSSGDYLETGSKNFAIVSPVVVSNKEAVLEDHELVAAAVGGELEAFAELVRRHQSFVYGACMRIVKNPALAEDLTQETFIRAWRALPDFEGNAKVRSWLYRIGHNLSLNAVTRAREHPAEELPERQVSRTPEGQAVLAEMSQAMHAAIESLPMELKEPLVLRELEHMAYDEIARHLDLPLNTVRTRLFRARRMLQAEMEEWR